MVVEFFQYVSDVGGHILGYFDNIPIYFQQIRVWWEVFWIKLKLGFAVEFLKLSYLVAQALLDEIGFSSLFTKLFNALPSELRYWGVLFKIPEGLAIYVNCATTALVMRMSR